MRRMLCKKNLFLLGNLKIFIYNIKLEKSVTHNLFIWHTLLKLANKNIEPDEAHWNIFTTCN